MPNVKQTIDGLNKSVLRMDNPHKPLKTMDATANHPTNALCPASASQNQSYIKQP